MDALDETLASDLADKLARPATPAEEVERMADVYRRAVASYMKRAADARKRGKGQTAELEDERRRLKEIHRQDMARIDEEVALVKALAADEVAACEKMAAVSRTALEALQS